MNQEHISHAFPVQESDNTDDISLSDIVRTLWQHRALMLCLTGLGALLGLGISFMSLRYVSEGLFIANAPVESYKRYESVLVNGPRLAQFLRERGAKGVAISEQLLKLSESEALLGKAIRPEFGFTEKDAKTFGVQPGKAAEKLDFRLRHESAEPNGGAAVTLLAEFVRDAVIRVDLEAATLSMCNDYRVREQTLRNEQIQNTFDIRQQETRAATLRTLTTRSPEALSPDARQIVAVDKGTERFLSPRAQLTAVEVQIADMRLDDERRERERTASALKRDYYCKAQKALQGDVDGQSFIAELGNIQKTVFEGMDRTSDVVEQTWNELELQRDNWTNTYLARMRFVAPPDGAEVRERKPGPTLATVLGLILGGMIGVIAALVAGWWQSNHTEVAARGEV